MIMGLALAGGCQCGAIRYLELLSEQPLRIEERGDDAHRLPRIIAAMPDREHDLSAGLGDTGPDDGSGSGLCA